MFQKTVLCFLFKVFFRIGSCKSSLLVVLVCFVENVFGVFFFLNWFGLVFLIFIFSGVSFV